MADGGDEQLQRRAAVTCEESLQLLIDASIARPEFGRYLRARASEGAFLRVLVLEDHPGLAALYTAAAVCAPPRQDLQLSHAIMRPHDTPGLGLAIAQSSLTWSMHHRLVDTCSDCVRYIMQCARGDDALVIETRLALARAMSPDLRLASTPALASGQAVPLRLLAQTKHRAWPPHAAANEELHLDRRVFWARIPVFARQTGEDAVDSAPVVAVSEAFDLTCTFQQSYGGEAAAYDAAVFEVSACLSGTRERGIVLASKVECRINTKTMGVGVALSKSLKKLYHRNVPVQMQVNAMTSFAEEWVGCGRERLSATHEKDALACGRDLPDRVLRDSQGFSGIRGGHSV